MKELAVARIRRTHGVRGELRIESLSGDIDHLLELSEVSLVKDERRLQYAVETSRPAGDTVLMKLAGLESPEQAQSLVGYEIRVPRDQASPLGEGEYYAGDLEGAVAVQDGSRVGVVRLVVNYGASDLLEIDRGERGKSLVPFIDDFVGDVDLERGIIEIYSSWEFD